MHRTIKHSLLGFVGSAVLGLPAIAQDMNTAGLSAWLPKTASKVAATEPSKSAIQAYEAAGYDVFEAEDYTSIELSQSGPYDISIGNAESFTGVSAVETPSKSIVRVEFVVEALAENMKEISGGRSATPKFHCGLVYNGSAVFFNVFDAESIRDKSLSDEDDAAQKIAYAFTDYFDTAKDATVVVTRRANKVTIELVGVDEPASIGGVSFGGDSKRFKITAGLLSTYAFVSDLKSYKLEKSDGETGGPLGWPVDPSKDGVDPLNMTDTLEDIRGL